HQREMKKLLPKWEKLCTPTYVLVGEQDAIADTANYSFAKKHIVNCKAVFMKLKNTGHQITHQQPELIKELLLEQIFCENEPIMAENNKNSQNAEGDSHVKSTLRLESNNLQN